MITITDAASAHIKKMILAENAKGFRLSLTKTGCSGLSYKPAIVQTIHETDLYLSIAGLAIYLDANYTDILKDIQIDYVCDESNGIKQKRLVFINPNEKARCGCGESFTT